MASASIMVVGQPGAITTVLNQDFESGLGGWTTVNNTTTTGTGSDLIQAAAGQLVTLFALAYAMAAPIMATLTAAMPRRPLLVTAMAVFTAANIFAAVAPGYGWLARARACSLPFPPPPTRPPRARWPP